MPKLRIEISGLCFMAFDEPLKGAQLPKRADVLLQRLLASRQLKHVDNQGNQEVLDQHFPLLTFDLDDWQPESTLGASFQYSADTNQPVKMTRGACILVGDDMQIIVDGVSLGAGGLDLSVRKPLNSDDLDTLWWVPTLEDAFPNNGAIDPVYRTTPPAENQKILARLPLTEGKLRVLELYPNEVKFAFGSSAFKQQIAVRLGFEIAFQSKVEVAITRRREHFPEQALNLLFKSQAGADVVLELKNSEINEFIGVPKLYAPQNEADFEIYVDLLPQNSPVRSLLPTFLTAAIPGSPTGVGKSACPPGA